MRMLYDGESYVKRSPLSVRQMAQVRTMDDKEFKRRLTEVADWIIPTDVDKPYAKPKRRKKRDEQLVELVGEDSSEETPIAEGPNPTMPPALVKLRRQAVTCDDCGEYCPNGREKEAKLHTKGNKQVWRQKCLTCKMFQNPFTGEFNLTGSAASIKFNDFMRETKGVYKTKGNAEREKVKIMIDKTVRVIDNEHETITFYHEKNKPA